MSAEAASRRSAPCLPRPKRREHKSEVKNPPELLAGAGLGSLRRAPGAVTHGASERLGWPGSGACLHLGHWGCEPAREPWWPVSTCQAILPTGGSADAGARHKTRLPVPISTSFPQAPVPAPRALGSPPRHSPRPAWPRVPVGPDRELLSFPVWQPLRPGVSLTAPERGCGLVGPASRARPREPGTGLVSITSPLGASPRLSVAVVGDRVWAARQVVLWPCVSLSPGVRST